MDDWRDESPMLGDLARYGEGVADAIAEMGAVGTLKLLGAALLVWAVLWAACAWAAM